MTAPYSDADVAALAERLLDHSLPKAQWTHAAHLTATLRLVRTRDVGLERDMPRIIQTYNVAVGGVNDDHNGYHETITQAYLTAIRAFVATLSAGLGDGEAAARVGGKAHGFETQTLRRSLAAGGEEHHLGPHLAAVFEMDKAGVGGDALDLLHLALQAQRDAAVAHVVDEFIHELLVDEGQQRRRRIDDRDLHVERAEDGRVFDAEFCDRFIVVTEFIEPVHKSPGQRRAAQRDETFRLPARKHRQQSGKDRHVRAELFRDVIVKLVKVLVVEYSLLDFTW